jgi:hypothetical protein
VAPPLFFLLFLILIVIIAIAVFGTGLGGALWGDRTRRRGDAEMHTDDVQERDGAYEEQRRRERSTSFTDHPSSG